MYIQMYTHWRLILNSASLALVLTTALFSSTTSSFKTDDNAVSHDYKTLSTYKDLAGSILDPEEYHAHSEPQAKWETDFVDKIKFKGTENILHVGSADGRVTTHIASKLKQGNVVGIDTSSYMVEFAKKRYESSYKNLSFEQKDIQNLDMNKQFDIALSSGAFNWFKDNNTALESLAHVLKHGGHLHLRVYANTISSESPKQDILWKAIDNVASSSDWNWIFYKPESVFYSMSKAELENALQEAGFTKIKIKETICKYSFKDKQGMLYWLWPWRKAFQRLPSYVPMQESTYKGFIEDIISTYAKIMKLKNLEHIPLAVTMLEVEAVKEDKW